MAPGPSADEAAAIAAAIDRFRADTAPAGCGEKAGLGPWRRAALIEGVGAKGAIGNLDGKGGVRWLS
jgi:hypothetical protein